MYDNIDGSVSSEGTLNEASSPQYLAELSTNVPTTRNVQYYTDIVLAYSIKT